MRRSFLVISGLMAITGFMALAAPASASAGETQATTVTVSSNDVSPAWFGAEHVTVNTSTNWGGWVDGNGPDSYQAVGICNNGSVRYGTVRWAGDRRGSFVYCASGFAGHYFAKIYA